jgi:hypothetical protein
MLLLFLDFIQQLTSDSMEVLNILELVSDSKLQLALFLAEDEAWVRCFAGYKVMLSSFRFS